MPRSSRHKSHKQGKHTSKDYSDSEEDVKVKDKSSKDENLVRLRDSFSGEKRKISSLTREGKEGKEHIAHGNGDASEEYVSSKRRKEKSDVGIGGDRWNGGGEERVISDRMAEKEASKRDGHKIDSKSKEVSDKSESSRISLKDKSKKYESGGAGEFRDEILTSAVLEKEDVKSKGESKRKHERDHSLRKEGKEFREKDHRVDKEKEKDKIFGHESKWRDTEVKLVDKDGGKRLVSQPGDHQDEKQSKPNRENPDFSVHKEIKIHELENDDDKKFRQKRETSKDRGHRDGFKESEERGSLSRSGRSKDVSNRDEKQKDKYHDVHENDGQRDLEEPKKDTKHKDDKYGDVEKDAKRRDDQSRDDSVRESRYKNEKHREGERDTKKKVDKYRDGLERDGHRDYKHHDDRRDRRRRDERFREDGDKDARHKNGKYYEDGDRYDSIRDNKYKEDGNRDTKKEENLREDNARGRHHKDCMQGNEFDREKRTREVKYHEELASVDRPGDKSDSTDDLYAADHHFRKSSAFDVSPTNEDHTVRYKDDQGRRRSDDKEDFSDLRSRSSKDKKFDAEKRIGTGARIDSVHERGSSTPRNTEFEQNASHRRRSSPNSSSLAPRDHYRPPKQDEFRYRDYSYEERPRHNTSSSRDYTGIPVGSEKPLPSRSLEKFSQKEDGDVREFSAERHIHLSPLKPSEKSPSSNADKRHLSRSNTRLSIDVEESAHRSGGSRDVRDYSGNEYKESHDLAMDGFTGDELSQADADNLSVSSPFARNNHLSSSSKSFPPPYPVRTAVDSPLISGSVEDNRFKSNNRFRRGPDPNLGRNQGNTWRGVPSWPSSVANGFMSFPHPPPPVSFPPAMQPLPVLPLYGIRPSMELSHPTPFHISDADRFPVQPIGWHNPVDDSRPQMHSWDVNNTVFRNDPHMYVRSGWDNYRNMPDGRDWDTAEDIWKGPNKTANFEMPSFEKESHFNRNINEALADQSLQSAQKEQIGSDQPEVSTYNHLIYDNETSALALQADRETSDITKSSKKDDMTLCQSFLSRLDISSDLTELELLAQCSEFTGVDRRDASYVDRSKIFVIEDTLEAKVASSQILSCSLPIFLDDSVFQRAMSFYKRQKDELYKVANKERFFTDDQLIPESDRGDLDKELRKTDQLSAKDSPMDLTSESHTKDECCPMQSNQMSYLASANAMIKSEEPGSTLDHMQVDLASTLLPHDHIVESKPLTSKSSEVLNDRSDGIAKMKNGSNAEDLMLINTKCDTLLISDVCSDAFEANVPESAVPESVNLSRIHHSSENTY